MVWSGGAGARRQMLSGLLERAAQVVECTCWCLGAAWWRAMTKRSGHLVSAQRDMCLVVCLEPCCNSGGRHGNPLSNGGGRKARIVVGIQKFVMNRDFTRRSTDFGLLSSFLNKTGQLISGIFLICCAKGERRWTLSNPAFECFWRVQVWRDGVRSCGNRCHNETKGCLLFTAPLGLNTLAPNGRNARTSSIRVTCKRRLFTPFGTGPVER